MVYCLCFGNSIGDGMGGGGGVGGTAPHLILLILFNIFIPDYFNICREWYFI